MRKIKVRAENAKGNRRCNKCGKTILKDSKHLKVYYRPWKTLYYKNICKECFREFIIDVINN